MKRAYFFLSLAQKLVKGCTLSFEMVANLETYVALFAYKTVFNSRQYGTLLA